MDVRTIPLDIWRIIFNFLDFLSQIRFRKTHSYLYKNLSLIEIANLTREQFRALDNRVLEKHTNLKVLEINRFCYTSKAVYFNLDKHTKLERLSYHYLNFKMNPNLSLINLGIYLDFKLNPHLSLINLTNLSFHFCNFAPNISHLTRLQRLKVYLNDDNEDNDEQEFDIPSITSITKLVLREHKVQNLNYMTHLLTLKLFDCYGLGEKGMSNLVNLTNLLIKEGSCYKNLNHFTNLRKLNIRYLDDLNHDGIIKLTNLEDFTEKSSFYQCRMHLNHLDKLTSLNLGYHEIKIGEISNLTNLRKIILYNNKVQTFNEFWNLPHEEFINPYYPHFKLI